MSTPLVLSTRTAPRRDAKGRFVKAAPRPTIRVRLPVDGIVDRNRLAVASPQVVAAKRFIDMRGVDELTPAERRLEAADKAVEWVRLNPSEAWPKLGSQRPWWRALWPF